MTMWTYIDKHPWLALIYLLIIIGGAIAAAQELRKK